VARAEFTEEIPRIDGRVKPQYSATASALYGENYESPPRWQGGRYSAVLVKENGQWHIRSLELLEKIDSAE
jgi:hypothetical protein